MDRRTFLVGGSVAAAGMATGPAYAQYFDDAWLKAPPQRPLAPADIQSAVARLRKQFLAEFDPVYVENVIVPHFLVSVYDGERPTLPMIGEELTKETAPFGFGYRRCPGEQLTIQVFEDFLRKVWKSKIEFSKLDIANPEPLPIGPATVIGDNVGFTRSA